MSPTSPSYLTFVIDQLTALGRVTASRMFGGSGLYRDGMIFGLIAEDILYFKVDDSTRGEYEQLGMPPLRPVASKPRLVSKNYYQVPADVLDDPDTLCEWARRAVSAAGAKKRQPMAAKKKTPTQRNKSAKRAR